MRSHKKLDVSLTDLARAGEEKLSSKMSDEEFLLQFRMEKDDQEHIRQKMKEINRVKVSRGSKYEELIKPLRDRSRSIE